MTSIRYETVLSTIGTFTNPRLRTPDRDCDSTEPVETESLDEVVIDPQDGDDPIRVRLTGRTRAQLLLEGFVAACELASRTGKLPRNGGVKPAVIVTVGLDDLRERLGEADTTFAGPVPAAQIRPQPRIEGHPLQRVVTPSRSQSSQNGLTTRIRRCSLG
ncbi:DUF222 domain-containing protein [Microbacteriaceae bacterium VKM Ac-2854]|nr:DUF222 domain-containing protein [Microbacteriaceae bacterium VKM Ac-2854]